MPDINFLSSKDNKSIDQQKKSKREIEKEKKIEWSKPDREKIAKDKKKSSGWFAFFKKKSLTPQAAGIIPQSKTDKKAPLKKDKQISRRNLKHSRQEVLKLIKEYDNKQDNKRLNNIKTKRKFNFKHSVSPLWNKLRGKFKKNKDHEDILIDYQQVFNKEKQRRDKINKKPIKKHLLPQSSEIKISKKSLLDQLIDFWRKLVVEKVKLIKQARQSRIEQKVADQKKKEQNRIERKAAHKRKQEQLQAAKIKKLIKIKEAEKKESEKINEKEHQKKLEKFQSTEWENPDILETNLIKGEIISFFNWKKNLIILLNTVILACLIIGAIYGCLIYWQQVKEKKVKAFDQKFIELNSQIKQAEENIAEILLFQQKIKLAGILLDKHIYWTNFFSFLEDNIIADVYCFDFSGDIKGYYNIAAMAKSFSVITQQIQAMQEDDRVVEAKVMGGSLSQAGKEGQSGGIKFNLELSVNPKIFFTPLEKSR
ncbi:MAG: hypothetical protein U9R14_00545 [Patescibacteria group bacterium]|nr:hypothetical protein [Patescibacteria group bacterium]